MATKKISIAAKPSTSNSAEVDSWVANRLVEPSAEPESVAEPMKRLTIDLPESLHRSIKLYCLMHNTSIAELARELFSKQCK